MTQKTSGVYSILSQPWAYSFVQNLVGSKKLRSKLVKQHILPCMPPSSNSFRMLDIGCGPGDILEYLNFPSLVYCGFDMNPAYIMGAKKRFGHRARFFCEQFSEATQIEEKFDLILAQALLHHLNDSEVIALYRLAKTVLKPGGRIITVDPCYVTGQSAVMRWITSLDRGQNIRKPQEYCHLAQCVFEHVYATIRNDLHYIPYSVLIQEAHQPASSILREPQPYETRSDIAPMSLSAGCEFR